MTTPFLKNKKAYFNYEILETVEAGLVLVGSEVKSLRQGTASIEEAFAQIHSPTEVLLVNMHIQAYQASPLGHFNPTRPRKLLLHKREIKKLWVKTQQKGLTLIPTKLYFKNGYAKIELALGRGKKLHDKRESIKKRDEERQIARAYK